MPIVQSGLDRFLGPAGRPWRKKRLGLMVHGASVTSRLEHTVDALRRKGFRLSALFAPEHGLAADLQDQAPVQGARDPLTKLPQKIQLAAFFRPQGQNFFVQTTVYGGPEPTGESRLGLSINSYTL